MTPLKSKPSHNPKDEGSQKIFLRVVGGPAAGREIPLHGQKVTIGRAASADIPVPDSVISRVHIAIFHDGKKWMIQDLGSTNGTWVDGEKITGDTELPLRTPVRIGNTLFELSKSPQTDDQMPALDESLISYQVSPITIDSLSLDAAPEDLKQSLCFYKEAPADAQIHREQQKLTAIYQVQSLLAKAADETELYHRILEVVDEVIPSDSSYLLLYDLEVDALNPVAGRTSNGRLDAASNGYFSKSIINYVKKTNNGILSVDAPNDERFLAQSLCEVDVQSVMCVPMLGKHDLCGLVYLSSKKSDKDVYDEGDLKLLTMIAYSAGMAIENNRLVEENIRAERMAAVGVTAAGLSHYVKNILNGLEGSVSLLRMGIDTGDKSLMDKAWDILSRNHKRLSSLVLDMLNLAKEDSAQLLMCNISNIVIETVELVEPRAKEVKINIKVDEKVSRTKVVAEADSRGIHRVLLNLLNNAMDAVKECHGQSGKGAIRVGLDLENHGQTVAMVVKDNGLGILPENQKKVFEMFYSEKGKHGTGLGLAVSKRIIENHRGTISVKSQAHSGAEFVVRIPVRQQDDITGYIPQNTRVRFRQPDRTSSIETH